MSLAICFDDIRAAAQRLQGVAHRTPVLTSRTADERSGAQVFFKAENLQRMGAFKFRGAYNALAQFTPEQRRTGVIAFSSTTIVANLMAGLVLRMTQPFHTGDFIQAGEHFGIAGKEQLVRVLARQKVHQQLVQIVAAEQRLASKQGLAALPFGFHQGQHFALAGPADLERLEGHQQAANRCPWTARTARQQGHATEITGKYFDNETGFPKRVGMQDVGRLAIDFAAQVHS